MNSPRVLRSPKANSNSIFTNSSARTTSTIRVEVDRTFHTVVDLYLQLRKRRLIPMAYQLPPDVEELVKRRLDSVQIGQFTA